ncbi:hypothetical protein MMC13_001899 [Lambiella insularis]|nr:hypothetical protein [Lambiella insularis]
MRTPSDDDATSSIVRGGSAEAHYGLPDLSLPAAPRPSADAGMRASPGVLGEELVPAAEDHDINIFTLSPVIALKMLCSLVDDIVHITGDIPPTPPVSLPNTPKVRPLQENRANHNHPEGFKQCSDQEDHDVLLTSKTPMGSPEAHPTEAFHIIGSDTKPLHIQDGALIRKFYSKRSPPIPLEEYLLRLHCYCPMSTAVYLATAFYIHKLSIIERIVPVTGRNAHRLVLAGLRSAMKALEDLSYPHRRFAKVGGVSEPELGRLEISFCFLMDFDFRVDKEILYQQALMMRDGLDFDGLPKSSQLLSPVKRRMTIRSIVPETVAEANSEVTG